MNGEIKNKLDLIIEEIINDYNKENDTEIKFGDLNIENLEDKIIEIIWEELEYSDTEIERHF